LPRKKSMSTEITENDRIFKALAQEDTDELQLQVLRLLKEEPSTTRRLDRVQELATNYLIRLEAVLRVIEED
jgi:hypothetical protein